MPNRPRALFSVGEEVILLVTRWNGITCRPVPQRGTIENRHYHQAQRWFPRGGWWYSVGYTSPHGKPMTLSRHEDDLEEAGVTEDETRT